MRDVHKERSEILFVIAISALTILFY